MNRTKYILIHFWLFLIEAQQIPLMSISPTGNILEGTDVTLTCKSRSDIQVLSYSWYKHNISNRLHTSIGNAYTIKNIRPEDSGEYLCGYECANQLSANVDLHVYSK